MIVFNTGDSHTVDGPWCPDPADHYWYKLAKNNYGCTEFINDSKPGRSNDMMIKIVMKHALENPDADVIYIINITTIFRFDLKYTHSSTLHNVLIPSAIADMDFETIECSLYTHLIGLIEFLKSRNKQFLIINNGRNFSEDQLPIRDAYVAYFKQESRILNWFNNARVHFHEHTTKIKPNDFDNYGWDGHNGAEAQLEYYKMLSTRLPNL